MRIKVLDLLNFENLANLPIYGQSGFLILIDS